MCDYTQVEYGCGHLRWTVRAWCEPSHSFPYASVPRPANRRDRCEVSGNPEKMPGKCRCDRVSPQREMWYVKVYFGIDAVVVCLLTQRPTQVTAENRQRSTKSAPSRSLKAEQISSRTPPQHRQARLHQRLGGQNERNGQAVVHCSRSQLIRHFGMRTICNDLGAWSFFCHFSGDMRALWKYRCTGWAELSLSRRQRGCLHMTCATCWSLVLRK